MVDDYAWLQDREDPDTIAYLQAESDYAAAATAHLSELRAVLLAEFQSRIQETDLTVPVRKGSYWYYNRTEVGQPYILHCRVPVDADPVAPPAIGDGGPLPGEEVLLDRNVLANGSPYVNVGVFDISPDGRLLAYAADHTGAERFTLRIKNLVTGELLPDEIFDLCYTSAWCADSMHIFYVTTDDAGRPHRIWQHRVGSLSDDRLVYEEQDQRFRLTVALSRSKRFIIISSRSRTTSEVLVVPADRPNAPPMMITARRSGVDYSVDHQGDRFIILHNAAGADFALACASVDTPGEWFPLVDHVPGTRLTQVHALTAHVVLTVRHDGVARVRILPRSGGTPRDIAFPEPLYTVQPDRNLEYHTDSFRVRYNSLVTPNSVYDCDLNSGALTLLKQTKVHGFRDDHYEQHREWAVTPDGVRVPVSIVARRGIRRDGSAAGVLYAYGAYEASTDPWFSATRLSLLDRGVVFAIAHTRGGGELGRRWYENGRLLAKKNTFTDFVAVAKHLAQTGWISAHRLVARGASAGGLLMGAVANLAPERFAGIVAQVPFVDPLTTMLDPRRPLTVAEWEEWGNPADDPEAFAYLRSYAPYENVRPHPYPPILAVTSINDTRVGYHEAAKWVARIRALAPATSVLLRTDMHSGHGGPSGRYRAWREEAFVTAWILDRLNATTSPRADNPGTREG